MCKGPQGEMSLELSRNIEKVRMYGMGQNYEERKREVCLGGMRAADDTTPSKHVSQSALGYIML